MRTARTKAVSANDAELSRLIRAAQAGHAGAVDALVERLRPATLTFLAHYLGLDDAEDCTQVALTAVVGALGTIRPEHAGRYVTRVARTLVQWKRRERARDEWRSTRLALAPAPESPATPNQECEYNELVAAVGTILPRDLRDLVLGLVEGWSVAELARQRHLSEGAIRTRLWRARGRLRDKLGPYTDLLPRLSGTRPDQPRNEWSPPPSARDELAPGSPRVNRVHESCSRVGQV